MPKKLTFKKLAKKVLEEEKRPLTVKEIWEIAKKKGYDKLCNTKGKTPWMTIAAQLYVDTKNNPNSSFVRIDSKPRKFFLKNLNIPKDLEESEQRKKERKSSERDIYPILTYFVGNYLKIFTKTIYHEKSKRKRYSQWLHPDVVGVYFPIDPLGEWKDTVFDLAKEIGYPSITFYSFEVKLKLDFANLREAFFQAVSNSSWANEGYLVAVDINERNDELMYELKRLSSGFGIGIIKLNIEDPDSSKILLPARYKTDLDWETINKLANENPDFEEFLKRVRNDFHSKEIRMEEYDKIFELEEIKELIINRIKKKKNLNK